MNISRKVSVVLLSLIGFSAVAQIQQPAFEYGRNVLSVTPVQMSERTLTGVGIQYERFLSANGKFSLYLPLAYSFGHADPCDPSIKARIFYAYPGIKFYPTGYKHKVTYAVGPSLAVGEGTTNCNCFADAGVSTEQTKNTGYKPITEVGAIINNSITAQASKHLSIGAEVGIGKTFIDKEDGKDLGTDLMLQINFKIGYRW